MPGMGTYLQTRNPVVVSAFHSALLHQVVLIGTIVAVLSLVWNVIRTSQYRRAVAAGTVPPRRTSLEPPEPPARRVVRIGFGLLWVLDGLLQLQSGMPLGLASSVIRPSADTSPGWVQHLVNVGVTIWSDHPVQAAAAVVWVQVGIGALLLLAPRGRWSRLAGVASLGWGLVVWVFGEAFGGIFGQGTSWLFGAPGGVLFYCAAGALVALPESAWWSPRLGRAVVRVLGVFFVAMAVLQAWPGRGFWQGAGPGSRVGTLTAMVRAMAQTSQPDALSSTLRAFGRFDGAHGWAVNLAVVLVLAVIGAAFCWARPAVVRVAAVAAVVVCLADWVLVQDLGFLGGLGTDPNSMVPMVVLVAAGSLGVVRAAAPVVRADAVLGGPAVAAAGALPVAGRVGVDGGRWDHVTPGRLARALASVAALAVVLVGAVPMAAAAANPNADPILAEAADGPPNLVNAPAPPFNLVDQRGRPVSLAGLRGRTIALTFLDPVCTSDCPLIAQEFRDADGLLGDDAAKVAFVAVVANPIYRSVAVTDAFDRQEGLAHTPNWLFLTGSLSALDAVWNHYGVLAEVAPAGAMVDHSELAYLIDAHGRTREILSAVPGNGQGASSSFSVYLANGIEHVLHA